MLDSLIGKSVAVQANAGFLEMWKRSDLYLSVVNDEKLFEFLALMSQINDADMDAKMQVFYVAVKSYNAWVLSIVATYCVSPIIPGHGPGIDTRAIVLFI